MVTVLYGSTAVLAYVLSVAAAHLLLAAGREGQGAPCAAQVPRGVAVVLAHEVRLAATGTQRDGERSFLVESPRGEMMQVELLCTVGCSGGRLVSPCSATGFGGWWKAIPLCCPTRRLRRPRLRP